MSDFDKEAERERLREQYEREQQKREATEHMSDLLLKGATMTDAHCDECGDPIFRYDGQTFCPTCKREVTFEGETDADADADASADAAETAAETGDSGTAGEANASATSEQSPADVDTATERDGDARTEAPDSESVPSRRVEVPTMAPDSERTESGSGRKPVGDLADAHESLQNALLTFARQAEQTDDPRRATDALEAAREAAEAIAALDRVR